METLLNTVLSVALLTSAFSAPAAPANEVVFTRVLPQENYVGYVVEKNATLEAVALNAYGSEHYWTTLWNDNTVITDPDNIPAGTVVKIRAEKPAEPAELAAELTDRNNSLIQQKNTEYLISIGFLSQPEQAEQAPVLPTAVPTKAPVANIAHVPGVLSEEAITYLGNCEAGMNPAKNTGNGYYGAFQFSHSTWKSMNTGYERADLAPIEVQKAAVQQLLARSNIYNQFPGCAKKMRSAGLI